MAAAAVASLSTRLTYHTSGRSVHPQTWRHQPHPRNQQGRRLSVAPSHSIAWRLACPCRHERLEPRRPIFAVRASGFSSPFFSGPSSTASGVSSSQLRRFSLPSDRRQQQQEQPQQQQQQPQQQQQQHQQQRRRRRLQQQADEAPGRLAVRRAAAAVAAAVAAAEGEAGVLRRACITAAASTAATASLAGLLLLPLQPAGLAIAGPTQDLNALVAASVSYDAALSDVSRPAVVEFYADWCEVCRNTARQVMSVEQRYRDEINFVMINIDNPKWAEELEEFGVDGIPHFVFLDRDKNELGFVVGRIPPSVLADNLAALTAGEPSVPHSQLFGEFSEAADRRAPPDVQPRSHNQL